MLPAAAAGMDVHTHEAVHWFEPIRISWTAGGYAEADAFISECSCLIAACRLAVTLGLSMSLESHDSCSTRFKLTGLRDV
jgi:hypothetical protein